MKENNLLTMGKQKVKRISSKPEVDLISSNLIMSKNSTINSNKELSMVNLMRQEKDVNRNIILLNEAPQKKPINKFTDTFCSN